MKAMRVEGARGSKHSLFSPATRWMHWLRLGAIIYLVVTGFELGQPFILYNPLVPTWKDFVMNWMRGTHEMAGFILIATEIVRIYDFFRTREFKDMRVLWSPQAWKKQLAYYGLFGRRYHHPGVRYGPLQVAVYSAFYLAIVLISITGFLLFGANYKGPGLGAFIHNQLGFLYPVFGGLAGIRIWHIWLAWSIILFIVGHVYMVIWNTVENRDGTIDTMLVGTHMKVADAPESEREKILVLGLGNILFTDEGLGVHMVHYLHDKYRFEPEVDLIDGGTLAYQLTEWIAAYQHVLIVDAALMSHKPGTVFKFRYEDAVQWGWHVTAGAHEVEIVGVLASLKLLGELPDVLFVAMQPADVETTHIGLSPIVRSRMDALENAVIAQLDAWNVRCLPRFHNRFDSVVLARRSEEEGEENEDVSGTSS